ncbi:acyltransferase family protein [Streptomyces sp. NPDC088354]|uniref:acyltransferase family protein n=1 Tax=Streptomyces sp. NPDC088354 TaxID=3365856 RepID=UPI0037F6F2B4
MGARPAPDPRGLPFPGPGTCSRAPSRPRGCCGLSSRAGGPSGRDRSERERPRSVPGRRTVPQRALPSPAGGEGRPVRTGPALILPPYWAALAMSLVISWFVVPASHVGPPTGASLLVYGLVAQDVLTAPTPNGAFWSIGVEAELYLLFPLLLLVRRRFGAPALAACVTLPVVARGLMAADASPVEGANGLAPHLAPVFVAGMIGAGIVAAPDRVRRLPWGWFAVLAAVPVLALGVAQGSVWTVNHYFWVDLAVAPAMAMLLAAVATGRPALLVRLPTPRPVRELGGFSYSLYLIHLPLVMAVIRRVAPHFVSPGLPTFWFTLLVALPASVLGAWLFSRIFESPFKRNRSWTSLIAPVRARWTVGRTPVR